MGDRERNPKPGVRVNLLGTLQLLERLLTPALIAGVFRGVREKERKRKWTLGRMVKFWMEVIWRAPESLSHALAEVQEGRSMFVPRIRASDAAFFARSQDLSWRFFAKIFERFVQALVAEVPLRYAAAAQRLVQEKRFTDLLAIDGSRLDRVVKKLKILWNERAVVLPGCVLAVYDLLRGIPRVLEFCADAAASEMTRAKEALQGLGKDSLLVGDRLYCTGEFFGLLAQNGLWGVFRRNRRLKLRQRRKLREKRCGDFCLQEWSVQVSAGGGRASERERDCGVALRWIRFQAGSRVYDWLTNVHDEQRLSAGEILELYPMRWAIERMYFDLKEVLNLHRIYGANPNAVGLQVYAAGIVYAAMRVAQGEVAQAGGVAPEDISPAKFYPKMAAACFTYVLSESAVEDVVDLNPNHKLNRPTYEKRRFVWVDLDRILVRKRSDKRRRSAFSEERTKWKSFAHIPGGSAYLGRN